MGDRPPDRPSDLPPFPVVAPSIGHKFGAGDVRRCIADISMARKLLGYEPRVNFEEGMRELVAWGRGVEARDSFQKAYVELLERAHRGLNPESLTDEERTA